MLNPRTEESHGGQITSHALFPMVLRTHYKLREILVSGRMLLIVRLVASIDIILMV